MKFKNFVLVLVFFSFAAVLNVQAQFDISGSICGKVNSVSGQGIRRAQVSVLNLTTLETQTRITNDFGYFRFNDLPILNLYLVSVRSKRYFFTFSNQLVEFTNLEHNMIFTSDD